MPSAAGKEHSLLTRFLRTYDRETWADAKLDWLDERLDGAVDVLATRACDGVTLAIEHTVVQPHPQEKEDFAKFRRVFPTDISDPALEVEHGFLYVDVPFGALQKGLDFQETARDVLEWIRTNKDSIPEGRSQQACQTGGRQIVLQTRLVKDPRSERGKTIIRRYGEFDLAKTVRTALSTKLPKLVGTPANRRLLMLERDQWGLDPHALLSEIEAARSLFPLMASVDEFWMAETHEDRTIVLFNPLVAGHGYNPVYTFTGDKMHAYHD